MQAIILASPIGHSNADSFLQYAGCAFLLQLAFTVPQDHSARAEEGGGRRLELPQKEALRAFEVSRSAQEDEQLDLQQMSKKEMHGAFAALLTCCLLHILSLAGQISTVA